MASVTLEQVTKRFRTGRRATVTAVHDLSLHVDDRSFLVLVGPSGCGKSTTLRLVAGLEGPTQGTIALDGRVVNDVSPRDRDVAMVFQNYALYPHMTVYKNLAFGLRMRRTPGRVVDDKVRGVAASLGLADLLDRKPASLSGGQQQRVALGRAVVREPRVFLMDEPLSNVDPQMRTGLRQEIRDLHRRLGTTVLYATHDQHEAMTLGNRVAVMREGVLQQCGAPMEVYERPANRFVAGFIGSPAMNFLDGRVEAGNGRCVFTDGEFAVDLPDWLGPASDRLSDRPVVLGIRPERVMIGAAAVCAQCGTLTAGRFCQDCGRRCEAEGGDGVSASVDAVEAVGAECFVTLRTAGATRLIARTHPAAAPTEGEATRVALDPAGSHLFETGECGANIRMN